MRHLIIANFVHITKIKQQKIFEIHTIKLAAGTASTAAAIIIARSGLF